MTSGTRTAKSALEMVGLLDPLREMRNWVTRPEWWRRERLAQGFFAQLVPPRALVFDIGAHHGAVTERFVRLGARVVAVEPQPACCERLRSRFGGSAAFIAGSRVVVVPRAVGAAEGTASMAIATGSQVSSCNPAWPGRFPEQQWSAPIDVPVTTLDALIDQFGRPDFCKIDVEGFEPEVLRGLHSPIRSLSLEFTTGMTEQTIACLGELERLGYTRINYAHHLQYAFALPEAITPAQARIVMRDVRGGGDLYALR